MARTADIRNLPRKAISWSKDNAGLWALGMLLLGFLGMLGGVGTWALNARDSKLMAQDKQLQTLVSSEVRRLDERIDDTRLLLELINQKMDKLDSRIDKLDGRIDKLDSRIDKLDSRVDAIHQILLERLPAPQKS